MVVAVVVAVVDVVAGAGAGAVGGIESVARTHWYAAWGSAHSLSSSQRSNPGSTLGVRST